MIANFYYLCSAILRKANPEGIPKASRRHPEGMRQNQDKKQGILWQE